MNQTLTLVCIINKRCLFFLAANKKKGQAGKTKGKKKGKSRLRNEFKMDIKDMIVKKRLASLNASAIMSASYAQERPLGKIIMSC